jgi:hypothetical protein
MATTLDKFMIPEIRQRIRYLLGINARDIKGREYRYSIDYYFERKLAAYFGLLYRELERGSVAERYYVYALRRLRATRDRVESIRSRWPEITGTAKFYATAVLTEWDARQGIAALEMKVESKKDIEGTTREKFLATQGREPEPDELEEAAVGELLDRAIELKTKEATFLKDLIEGLKTRVPERPEWAEEVSKVFERVKKRLTELLSMKPLAVLYRLHVCHMWYRSYKARETPDPYAMVSVFVYTRRKEKYEEWMFGSALDFLERREEFEDYDMMHPEEPSAFPTFHAAEVGASKAAVRKGFVAPGAYYEVEGWEFPQEVDEDEKGDYEEDEWRYYVAFYRTRGGKVEIYREYYGKLEPVMAIRSKTTGKTSPITWEEYMERTLKEDEQVLILSWRIFAQDKSPPIWKKTEELGWPDVLEP